MPKQKPNSYALPSNLAAIAIMEDGQFMCRLPGDRDLMIEALEEALILLAEMQHKQEEISHEYIH